MHFSMYARVGGVASASTRDMPRMKKSERAAAAHHPSATQIYRYRREGRGTVCVAGVKCLHEGRDAPVPPANSLTRAHARTGGQAYLGHRSRGTEESISSRTARLAGWERSMGGIPTLPYWTDGRERRQLLADMAARACGGTKRALARYLANAPPAALAPGTASGDGGRRHVPVAAHTTAPRHHHRPAAGVSGSRAPGPGQDPLSHLLPAPSPSVVRWVPPYYQAHAPSRSSTAAPLSSGPLQRPAPRTGNLPIVAACPPLSVASPPGTTTRTARPLPPTTTNLQHLALLSACAPRSRHLGLPSA